MLYLPPAAGAIKLLSVANPVAAAVVDFTGLDGTYHEYLLECLNVLPVVDNDAFQLRTSEDGGATFTSSAAAYTNNTVSATEISLGTGVSNVASEGGACALLRIIDPASTTAAKIITGQMLIPSAATATTVTGAVVGGRRNTAAAINALRIYFAGGNIASGKFKLYGLSKS